MSVLDPWELVEPARLISPTWSFTRGPEVADLADLMGMTPMPEQEQWLDAAFGVDSDGKPACTDLTDIAGRQNQKTGEFVMTGLGWLFITKDERTLWSAHEFDTARDAFLLMRSLLEAKPWADRRVRHYYASSNFMGVVLNDRRLLQFTARTTSTGRGKSAPKAIWDEGLELLPEHLGAQDALRSTYPWAQKLIGSSAAKSYSEVLHGIIDKAERGQLGPRSFYREYRDDLGGACQLGDECTHVLGSPGCRLDDPRRWKRTNPALGRIHDSGRGLTYEAIAGERRDQPNPWIFARERLGWRDRLIVSSSAVFTEEGWLDVRDPTSRIVSARTFCLQVSPNRDWSAVVAGGRNDAGRIHLEVPSKRGATEDAPRTYARWKGTDRVLDWFRKALRKQDIELLILAGSAAASLVPALERLNDDPKLRHRLAVTLVPESSMPAACGNFVDAVARQDIVHVGDPELQASILSVGKKQIAERAFVWSPRNSAGDITVANAATILAWHLEQNPDYNEEDSVG